MTHYSVIVIGDDPEEQLEPFSVHLKLPEYFTKNVWIPKGIETELGKSPNPIEIMQYMKNHFSENYVICDGELGRLTTGNPNAHWDWHCLGGRWSNFFPLKAAAKPTVEPVQDFGYEKPLDGYASAALKRDIDFERAKSEAVEEARKAFGAWRHCYEVYGKPKTVAEIDAGLTEYTDSEKRRNVAVNLYDTQNAILEFRRSLPSSFECPIESYGFDEEIYVERRRLATLVPYAFVYNGKWTERKSSWSDADTAENRMEWCKEFHQVIDSLSDDILLSLYDCHF